MTPMFQQYHALKQAQPNAILFFRMGDFYEVFYDDAKLCSKVLDLTLTARNKQANPIPMAGVPHHAADGYIQKLVENGFRVAIAEQVEDPRQAKGLVKRDIVRVVTPSVVLDPTTLAQHSPNYLVSIVEKDKQWALCFLDVSTGDCRYAVVSSAFAVAAEINRLEPAEAILGPHARKDRTVQRSLRGVLISELDDWDERTAELEIRNLSPTPSSSVAVRAVGAAIRYGRSVSGGELGNVHGATSYEPQAFMHLDESTRRNLELVRTLISGQRRGSLLHLLDRSRTCMGSRLLREWLSFPLLSVTAVQRRQRAVQAFVSAGQARELLQTALQHVSDIERIGARVSQGTAHARDLSKLTRSLAACPEIIEAARSHPALAELIPEDVCSDVLQELRHWLADDPPVSLTEGGLIGQGAHEELDELIRLAVDGKSVLAELETSERQQTDIPSLKIRKNKVFGYYIEVTRAHLHRVPERYLRKQTLSNCERYITEELKDIEERVLGADERRKSLEYGLFVSLRDRVAEQSARLLRLSRSLATLDALAGMADAAVRYDWVCPEVDQSRVLRIEQGRHPVVEQHLDEERFVPNDLYLDPEHRALIVLTGPNMSGKSTTMRQAALIVLLAQIGSFVPASAAQVGLCDQIFTRVGAADDLSRGQSTFMVEMAETANILNHATERSFVILDEIGRGTSTYDGLSIAWAVAEDLVDRIGCRGIFATHYHELCELADRRSAVVNQSVAVSEYGDEVLFLRTLKEGGASRSYGIQCARIAGLPDAVVGRAKSLLTSFEKLAPRNERDQLSLFSHLPSRPVVDEPAPVTATHPVVDALDDVDPDTLSPRDALEALYRLKALLNE